MSESGQGLKHKNGWEVIFVQSHFGVGGIEVLELKLIERLLNRDINVTVACRANDAIDRIDGIRVVHHCGYPDLLSRSGELARDDCNGIILVTLHPTAALAAEIIGRKIRSQRGASVKIHHFHWVSHSRAFFFSGSSILHWLMKNAFSILPSASTHFMNEAALRAHEEFWGINLSSYPILRIVGREPTARHHPPRNFGSESSKDLLTPFRIVSVGRLVPFKGYNIGAVDTIKRLRNSGVNATWDIWGYGPDEESISVAAQKNGVDSFLKLRGPLDHKDFDRTVSDYDAFVGMGTAVLEAAKTEVPSIVAVENGTDASYGLLHQAPIDSVGDRVEGAQEVKLIRILLDLARKSPEERMSLGRKDAIAAKSKESTADDFIDAILNAGEIKSVSIRQQLVLWLGRRYLEFNDWRHRGIEN